MQAACFNMSGGAISGYQKSMKLKLFGIELVGSELSESVSEDAADANADSIVEEEPVHEQVQVSYNPNCSLWDEGKKFQCNYCGKIFPSSQAVGGHQNAHRRERHNLRRSVLLHHHSFNTYNVGYYRRILCLTEKQMRYGLFKLRQKKSEPITPASSKKASPYLPQLFGKKSSTCRPLALGTEKKLAGHEEGHMGVDLHLEAHR